MHERQQWQDAYDAQLSTWRWLTSEHGRTWLRLRYEWEVQDEPWPEVTKKLLAGMFSVEIEKVRGSSPYFVSSEMCEVVNVAREEFQPEPIYPTDFLTPSGFLYYEQPHEMSDRYGTPVMLHAFSWSPVIADAKPDAKPDEEEWTDDEMMKLFVEQGGNGGVALTLYTVPKQAGWPSGYGTPPPLVPLHLTPWWFDMTFDGNEIDADGKPTAAEEWWKIIQTTLRLMQQRMAVHHEQRPSRPQRREAERVGFSGQSITVVRLRREKSETSEGHEPSAANYSHRFIVGGHWRNQWYRSFQGHRQIWIAPYVKGDEDLPLVIKPRRVYTWTR